MEKIVVYCRTSTDNQKKEGTITIQHQALKEFANKKGFEIVKSFSDDGVSGGLEDRDGLAQMFSFLESKENKEVKTVAIWKLDRLARDLYIQEHLIKKLESLGVKLISTKEPDLDSNDPMRKAFRQFMGIVSELEKSFITMRLKAGRINKIKNKKQYTGGGIPHGYEISDGDLQISGTCAPTVLQIFKMKKQRNSLRDIARELNTQGVLTPRGGSQWYASTIRYILSNPLYKGTLSYSGIKATRDDLALL
jgi:site-specific DNA recombinase